MERETKEDVTTPRWTANANGCGMKTSAYFGDMAQMHTTMSELDGMLQLPRFDDMTQIHSERPLISGMSLLQQHKS